MRAYCPDAGCALYVVSNCSDGVGAQLHNLRRQRDLMSRAPKMTRVVYCTRLLSLSGIRDHLLNCEQLQANSLRRQHGPSTQETTDRGNAD